MTDLDMTDHKLMKVQFKFRKQEGEISLDNTPTNLTQREIRRAATSTKTIEKMLMLENILHHKSIDIYKEDIIRKKRVDQWYHPMKRANMKQRDEILIGEESTHRDRWRELAKQLEEMLKQNNIKQFYKQIQDNT